MNYHFTICYHRNARIFGIQSFAKPYLGKMQYFNIETVSCNYLSSSLYIDFLHKSPRIQQTNGTGLPAWHVIFDNYRKPTIYWWAQFPFVSKGMPIGQRMQVKGYNDPLFPRSRQSPPVRKGASFQYSDSIVCSSANQRKHQISPHWPLWGEITGHQWCPLTKGQ